MTDKHISPERDRRTTVYPAADEVLLGLAELKRLREVEKIAKELADRIKFYSLRVTSKGNYCGECLEDLPHHADDCLITRARKIGLLSE